MFCPNCGQERVSDATSFCSRCGFLLTGTLQLLSTGGVLPLAGPTASRESTPRSRGVKQGLFIFLLTFLIVPIVAIISAALDVGPWAIPITAVLLFVGGLLRMAYAAIFESGSDAPAARREDFPAVAQSHLVHGPQNASLPPSQMPAAAAFVPPQRRADHLPPTSVTEGTTKLLEREQGDQ